jgi:hypothetical protein
VDAGVKMTILEKMAYERVELKVESKVTKLVVLLEIVLGE